MYLYCHFQGNEKPRLRLHLPQKIVARLRSKSSPVTQVGIGMGIMFVDLCSYFSPKIHVVVYNVYVLVCNVCEWSYDDVM